MVSVCKMVISFLDIKLAVVRGKCPPGAGRGGNILHPTTDTRLVPSVTGSAQRPNSLVCIANTKSFQVNYMSAVFYVDTKSRCNIWLKKSRTRGTASRGGGTNGWPAPRHNVQWHPVTDWPLSDQFDQRLTTRGAP